MVNLPSLVSNLSVVPVIQAPNSYFLILKFFPRSYWTSPSFACSLASEIGEDTGWKKPYLSCRLGAIGLFLTAAIVI
jgi:hypothetical protein